MTGNILATAIPGFPVFDLAGLIGSTGWGLWVAAIGVTVLLRPVGNPIPSTTGSIPLGIAQALALPRRTHMRWVWAAAMPFLWALGWTTTTLGGIAVDLQFTVFGAYGAVTFAALSGLLLHRLLPHRGDAAGRQATPTPVAARV